jgi:hypothetical protein
MIELSCSPTIQMSIRIHCHIPTCSTTYGLSTGSSIFWLFSMCALATTARKSLFQLFSGSSATNHDTTKYGKWTKRCCHWKYGRNSIRHPAGGHNGNHYGCVISVGLLFLCSCPATGFDSFTDEQLMWLEGPQLREQVYGWETELWAASNFAWHSNGHVKHPRSSSNKGR